MNKMKIRKIRENHSLRQEDLAWKLGITQGMVSLLENNRANPSKELCDRFKSKFGIKLRRKK